MVRGVKTADVLKMGIGKAKLLGFLIHQLHIARFGACDRNRQSQGGICAAGEGAAIENIYGGKLLVGTEAGHGGVGGIQVREDRLGNCQRLLQILQMLYSHKGGHDLGKRRRGDPHLAVMLGQDPMVV